MYINFAFGGFVGPTESYDTGEKVCYAQRLTVNGKTVMVFGKPFQNDVHGRTLKTKIHPGWMSPAIQGEIEIESSDLQLISDAECQAYADGGSAFRTRVARKNNPHQTESVDRREWFRGWDAAETESRLLDGAVMEDCGYLTLFFVRDNVHCSTRCWQELGHRRVRPAGGVILDEGDGAIPSEGARFVRDVLVLLDSPELDIEPIPVWPWWESCSND